MKKQLFTLALLLVGAVANAQISKGDVQLTGTFNITNQDTPNGDFNTFRFSPQAGLSLNDNTSLGIALNYLNRKIPVFDPGSGNTVEQEITNFQYGVYARFYKRVADNFYLFLQPAVLLSDTNVEGSDAELTGFQIAATPGLNYFFSPKWAFEVTMGSVGYSQNKETNGGMEQKTSTFDLGIDLSNINIGLSLFLRKNQ